MLVTQIVDQLRNRHHILLSQHLLVSVPQLSQLIFRYAEITLLGEAHEFFLQ